MVELLRLLIAHILGDFVFQPRKIVTHRRNYGWKSKWLYIHVLVYSLLVYVALAKWNQALLILPFLVVTHFLMDGFRAKLKDNSK